MSRHIELMFVDPTRLFMYQRAADEVTGIPVMCDRERIEAAIWPRPSGPYRIYIEMIEMIEEKT